MLFIAQGAKVVPAKVGTTKPCLGDYFFFDEAPTQTPGFFGCVWLSLHREPDGQSLQDSQMIAALAAAAEPAGTDAINKC